MEFSKYEATANDFIMLDRMSGGPEIAAADVIRLCDRRTGIGADGVIEAFPSSSCDIRMRITNADGSVAEMCGNGARALFLFARDRGFAGADEITVETLAGPKAVREAGSALGLPLFSVDMGSPKYTRADIPMDGDPGEPAVGVEVELEGGPVIRSTCVSMGNPHCVVFVDDVSGCAVSSIGARLEAHTLFPARTNVEFVRVTAGDALEVRVWERGVGETMACGTGACAALVAANLNGFTGKRASVSLPGGMLEVEWSESGVSLTGPARHVFDGKTVD
jgi:diaminopimelate epimerase